MIYGWTQTFHATPDYILHGISYQNLILYGNAAPAYITKTAEEEEWDDSIDANNPDNFKTDEDEEEEFI